MKLILKASVTHLGEPGEVVVVKNGYARNYLIPQGLAVPATDANLRAIEFEIGKLKAAAAEQRAAAQLEADKMSGLALRFERKVADPSVGSLYGSVSVLDLADGLAAAGFDVDRGEIHLDQPVKRLGTFEVDVTLAYGVNATVKFKVVGEEGEEAPVVPDELVASKEVVQETLEAVEEAQADDDSDEDSYDDFDAAGDEDEEDEPEEEEIDLEDTV